ncbi:MAG: hypothetical protein KDB53_11150, partial [Planctomycetes bacterium]|nr:hypothetical protein [Planctomycetota bacterium]
IFTRIFTFPQITRIVYVLYPLYASPVHRVLLNDRSNASQSRLEGRLDDLQAWLGAAADAEQSLSQLRFGTQPPPTESAIAAHQGAFEALAATGLVDWGVLFEHLSYFVSRGDRQAALERIARWVSHRSPITRQSRYFVDRLQKMLASQGATPVWTLSAPELATIDPGSARPVWRMIEYRVPVEGQAIIGGLAPYGDLLRWRAIDAKGQPLDTWNHLALPFDGILPGETRGLLIRLTPETLARQPAALEFETRRGNRPIGEALTLSMKS